MTPEEWDAYASKFGKETAVKMLGARPMAAAPSVPEPAQPTTSPGTLALDLLQKFSQGATFGFGDEFAGLAAAIPGGMSPREAIDRSRQATALANQRTGGLGTVAELAGGLATGALLPMAGARLLAKAPALGGAVTGALESGGYAAGKAEGGVKERAKAAAVPAVIGGAVGAVAPIVANALLRRPAGQGARVAAGLRGSSGITEDINVTRQRVADMVDQVRADSYNPFSAMPKVESAKVIASGVPDDVARLLPKGTVGFEDLQGIRSALREQGNRVGADMLSDVMEQIYPGTKAADKAYFAAQEIQRAMDTGAKVAGKSGADIEWAAKGLSPAQQEPFRQMLVQRTADMLTLRDEQAGAVLNQMLDQGINGARRVRQLFPAGPSGDAGYAEFQRMIGKEKSAAMVGRAFKRIIKPLALMGAGAAGYEVYRR